MHSARATAVELCLFDDSGSETRLPLVERTGDVWHGYVPGPGPGTRYGLRAHGPSDPSRGLRHDPSKLLSDPYALALDGELQLDDALFTHGRDSAPYVPRSVVVDGSFEWGEDQRPGTSWPDTVVYELHVKGFTASHPGVPEDLRGTYAGLAHPAALDHLVGLGVTAVELLPVHHFVSEPHLLRRGLTNHWGYNTLGFLAPHGGYSSSGTRGGQVAEFKSMVRALHGAGLEVLLDVVYNHTAEGDSAGPTLSLRGLDNAGSYRLDPHDPSRYDDVTGCGSTVDLRAPHVLRLVMDSLRYWVQEMHVDGFRFDLAPALLRGDAGVDLRSAFLQAVQQDPVLADVKLVAEPWDVGSGGYQLGRFPSPWAEWNDRYRDGVRDAWRGAGGGVRELASRLSGSADVFRAPQRRPWASVAFVTAHDGFTLHDLTAYDRKHNEANGEDGRDGEDHNRSWNCGVEGETDDPEVLALRRRQARNLLATLLVSAGVPMISMGDEVRRTQRGNNNAYCQDSELSWQSWDLDPHAEALREVTARLVHLRREHPVLRQSRFLHGEPTQDGVKDLAWFGPSGRELTGAQWSDPAQLTLGMRLDGGGIDSPGPRGERVVDDTLLIVLHLGPEPTTFALPPDTAYEVVLDTAVEGPTPPEPGPVLDPGAELALVGRSVVILRGRR